MKLFLASACAALIVTAGWAQSASTGFDVSQLDRAADPCVDFYQFSCGGWRAKNPLPADRSRYNRYDEMSESNLTKLRTLLDAAAVGGSTRDKLHQQVGDYYAACMDTKTVENKKAAPIAPYLARIAALQDKRAMLALMAELDDLGLPMLFEFGATPDRHNSSMTIAELNQGGLTLPDRDYYLKADPKTTEQRQEYRNHVARMLTIAGEAENDAKRDADTVLRIETRLAEASLDRTAQRDPANLDHKMKVAEFNALESAEAQLAAALLLQGAGRERGLWPPLHFLAR